MSTEIAVLEHRARTYRDYPEDLKAAVINAIEANGGNVLATSRLFNLPRDTVNYWWHNSERFVGIQQASGECLADKLEHIAHSYADSLAAHDQSLVTARDKASIIGTTIDKMQLLRGQPTSITESHTVETEIILSLLMEAVTPTDTES